MPREELAVLQLELLGHSLEHAYENVAHYRKSFEANGVTPRTLTSLQDVRHFPFTDKDDLRSAYPFGMFAVPREQVLRVHASSGTTGRPTVVGYTKDDLDTWDELMARSMAAMGACEGDIFHNAYGYGLFTGGLGFHGGAQRLGVTTIPMSGGNTKRQIQLLSDFGATVLGSTPSYALHIAEVAEAEGIHLKSGPLRIGCFGAEPWSEAMRHELQDRLGIKAVDMYGLSEVMGPGVACECNEAQDGLHCWEDHFLFEIVDPRTGQPLPVGDTGELVITTLTKQALPVIRYRTRDITRLDDTICICGRTHARAKRITGRTDDVLIIRGVNVYPSQIESLLVGQPGIAPHYSLVVERDGAMDRVTIEVEALPDIDDDPTRFNALAKAVRHHIKNMAGITCDVDVKRPGEIPRSHGKASRVRDLRRRDRDPA
ncbi:MAG: phenylacetate--CoA ligase family protein [Alphaproteobacteria bacterium]